MRKILSFIIALVLFIQTSTMNCYASELTNNKIVCDVDGVTYVIESIQDNTDDRVIKVTNNVDEKEAFIRYNPQNSTVCTQTYERGNALLSSVSYEINGNQTDTEDFSSMSRAISYASVVKTPSDIGKNRYWYCTGSDGKKQYTKIGCIATYKIRTDTLNSANKALVKEYRDAVRSCKSNYNKADAALIGTGVGAGVIVGMIICNISFPPSVIVSIIVAAVGGGGSIILGINYLIDSYNDYQVVKDTYAVIKGLGTKL